MCCDSGEDNQQLLRKVNEKNAYKVENRHATCKRISEIGSPSLFASLSRELVSMYAEQPFSGGQGNNVDDVYSTLA